MFGSTERKIPQEAMSLLVTNGLNSVVKVFTKIFISVYFLKLTQWNLTAVVLYHIIYYFATGLFNYLGGNWVKCKNKMIPYRMGIVLQFVFFLMIILLKDSAAHYIYLLAVISGVSTALYWLPYHIIRFEVISHSDRSLFLSSEKALEDLLRIIVPAIIGSVVLISSYQPILLAALIATVLTFAVSFMIPNQEPSNLKFDIGEFWELLKQSKEKDVFRTYIGEFLRGINYIGALDIIIPIIIFVSFSSEFKLGVLSSIFSIVSILVSLVMGKYLKDKYFKQSAIVTGFLLFAATIVLVFSVNKPSIVFYNFVYALAVPVLLTLQTLFSYNIIDKENLVGYRVEHFAIREVIMVAGKILGLGLLLVVSLFGSSVEYLRLALVILSFTILLIPLHIRKFKSI